MIFDYDMMQIEATMSLDHTYKDDKRTLNKPNYSENAKNSKVLNPELILIRKMITKWTIKMKDF